jgi:hypothetical protein
MRGSCLCRAVTYETAGLVGPIVHCHCGTCRKAHAAAFTTTARVDRSGFRWLSGQDALGAYESTPGKLRHFCTRCGTQLISEWKAQPQVIVRIATLDEDPSSRPSAHIWLSHEIAWLEYGPELTGFQEGLPPGT